MRFLLLAFVVSCVFDPADVIVGGKTWLFALLWLATLVRLLLDRERPDWPVNEIAYVGCFIAIPLLSILWYYISDGRQPFDGFLFLKGYLLVSLVLVLTLARCDIVPMISAVLAVLAAAVVIGFAAIIIEPDLYEIWKPLGLATGLYFLDWRSYGAVTMLQVYFVTSPMLVIPVVHYFDQAVTSRKFVPLLLCGLCIAGMVLAGTRNNIFIAALLPAVIGPQYTRRPLFWTAASGLALAALALPLYSELSNLLDPDEPANEIRRLMVADYLTIWEDPARLLLGRGLGAYESWTSRSSILFAPVSELTFFEVIRNFGLIGGAVMIGLLLVPVVQPFLRRASPLQRSLGLAFLLYLAMSFSNPILFNSMGVLFLSALMAQQALGSEPAFRRVAPRAGAFDANANAKSTRPVAG